MTSAPQTYVCSFEPATENNHFYVNIILKSMGEKAVGVRYEVLPWNPPAGGALSAERWSVLLLR